MNLLSIRDNVHGRLNKLRALDRLVNSNRFAAAYKLVDQEDYELQMLLTNADVDALEAWIDERLVRELDDMSAREIRNRASKLGIPFYTTYNKSALILKIIEVQTDARKTEQTPVDVPASQNGSHSGGSGQLNGVVLATAGG